MAAEKKDAKSTDATRSTDKGQDKSAEAGDQAATKTSATAPSASRAKGRSTPSADKQPTDKSGAQSGAVSGREPAPGKARPAGEPEVERRAAAPCPVRGLWATLIVLFVLLAAALAGAAWYGWNRLQAERGALTQVRQQQAQAQQSLAGNVDQLQQRIDSLSSQLKQQDSQLEQKNQATTQRVTALEHNLARISDRLDRGGLAWRAAEIGFLLTRAQERLVIAHDPQGAVVALNLADQRMADLSRPALLPVRSAISAVRTRLHKLDRVDRVGLALKLRQDAAEVSDWPLTGAQPADQTAQSMSESSTQQAGQQADQASASAKRPWYQRAWDATRAWFGRQFTVTRSNEPVKVSARVPTDRETRLWLTAVREALLARDADSVAKAVQAADHWIGQHYAGQAQPVSDTLETLHTARSAFARNQWPSMAAVFKAWNASGLSDPDKLVGRKPSTGSQDRKQEPSAEGGAQ